MAEAPGGQRSGEPAGGTKPSGRRRVERSPSFWKRGPTMAESDSLIARWDGHDEEEQREGGVAEGEPTAG